MKVTAYSVKVGGFVSFNAGRITSCLSSAKIKSKAGAAGFVYDNVGRVESSLFSGKVKGKEQTCGFGLRNRGHIDDSGWICREPPVTDEVVNDVQSDDAPNRGQGTGADATTSENKKSGYADMELAVYPGADVRRRLLESGFWSFGKESDGEPVLNEEACRYDYESEPDALSMVDAVIISTAGELIELSEKIASGDSEAAAGRYILTADINLSGKKWLPIGVSESNPFTGVFDGRGFRISNFKIYAKDAQYAGFFGCVGAGAVICNLSIDCVVGAAGSVTGSMAGLNDRGLFVNCHAVSSISSYKSCGGFVGKNTGTIKCCSFYGSISAAIPIAVFLVPAAVAVFLLFAVGGGIVISRYIAPTYNPGIVDPNQRPADSEVIYDPPEDGQKRISVRCNTDVRVNVETMVGGIDYVNSRNSTVDVVIRVLVSDAELLRVMGTTGRSEKEQAELEADDSYDAGTSYQEIYRSGRIEIGYQIADLKLTALSDGTYLKKGEYEMLLVIDAYDPDSNDKEAVAAQLPINVDIVDP